MKRHNEIMTYHKDPPKQRDSSDHSLSEISDGAEVAETLACRGYVDGWLEGSWT